MAKYSYQRCKEIMRIYIGTIDGKIPFEVAKRTILDVANDFPIQNFKQYLRITENTYPVLVSLVLGFHRIGLKHF